MKVPRRDAAKECCFKNGYFILNGAKVRLEDDSIIGSFGVYTKSLVFVKSLHLNCEQHTVKTQFSQSLINTEDFIGPI